MRKERNGDEQNLLRAQSEKSMFFSEEKNQKTFTIFAGSIVRAMGGSCTLASRLGPQQC
jgi:hypothetical protein